MPGDHAYRASTPRANVHYFFLVTGGGASPAGLNTTQPGVQLPITNLAAVFACCLCVLQDAREVEDSARLRSSLGSGSSGDGSSGGGGCRKPQYGRVPPHSRMLETWILCELCNVGNMQDAVMLREHSVFFEGDTPQLVRAAHHGNRTG